MTRTPRIALAGLGLVSMGAITPSAPAIDPILGPGAAVAPGYGGSGDDAAAPLWNIRPDELYAPGAFVQVIGPQPRSNLLAHPHIRLGIAGRHVPDHDHVDDNKVEGLESTDAALRLGPSPGHDLVAGRETDMLVEVDAIHHLAQGDGGLIVPRGRVAWRPLPPLTADLSLSTSWASDDYMGNLFTVNGNGAARSGPDRHTADGPVVDDAGSGSRLSIGASVSYRLRRAGNAPLQP
jgi:outer membrane scaffolding protein for murein synthesis (MipA/OmpV family)